MYADDAGRGLSHRAIAGRHGVTATEVSNHLRIHNAFTDAPDAPSLNTRGAKAL